MLTRLGFYADKVIEYGWLAAAVFAPLFFNVYSSRVFEPDKISTLRSLVLVMALAWLIKALEGGVRAYRASEAPTRMGRVSAAVVGAADRGLPGWLGWLRVPMLVPIAVYALAYLISSIFTVTPDATIFGSYQRLQGTYSQYSYMLLGVMVIANMRTRVQLERLISFMILTSVPVVMYGFVQAVPLLNANLKLDPLPWAGDTSTRVASTMGNAIFVAAWLIMVVPLVLYRFFNGLSEAITARRALADKPAEPERARGASKRLGVDAPSYGWAVVSCVIGIVFVQMFLFYTALKVMEGLPFPSASMAWVLPVAILLFFLGGLLIEALGSRANDPAVARRYLPIVGVAVFFSAFLALPFEWNVLRVAGQAGENNFVADIGFDGSRLLWVMFLTLLWGALSAGVYTLAPDERLRGGEKSAIVRGAFNAGYGVLLLMLALCIYLTQSRGPWLGLGAGLVTFAVAMWLMGRRHQVRWMARFGGAVSAIALALAIFVGLLNIPESPLRALSNIPLLGRGIERLSTLARTEDGTGKVRTLIWQGATDLILSDPVRALIGWGPEAMYVAYNPFYPPELAQWELRNATPDRSHNVEFDQLVTLGVVGLLAYYFLVGAYFFYAMRLLKRVSTTRDRLLVIALISAMVAHFIEIQTGIQIAATWTYFYLIIGMTAAFGFYITRELRPAELSVAGGPLLDDNAEQRSSEANAKRSGDGQGTAEFVAASAGVPAQRQKKAGSLVVAARKERAGSRGSDGRSAQTTERRRASTPVQVVRDSSERRPFSDPRKLALYAAAALVVWAVNFGLNLTWLGIPVDYPGVNSATVRADSIYKFGLNYDQAKLWPESISRYREAIELQPGQDYYYLFLGRSWLEFAKQVDQERAGSELMQRTIASNPGWPENGNFRAIYARATGVNLDTPCGAAVEVYQTDADREAERICRLRQGEAVLKEAQKLNPLNTDHYANLGRLYLYWADDTGANDPSKRALAVENFEAATRRTPGNAQLWDELGVAYARAGQFDKAMEALLFSQYEVDPFYARTPFIRGQLLQERVVAVREALIGNAPLPTAGETDYGKLLLQVGQAYSDTIALDPTQFVEGTHTGRIDFILQASQTFTRTNTTLDEETVRNVLTSTVTLALEKKAMEAEQSLANYLREQGGFSGGENAVPSATLQALWQDPRWTALAAAEGEARVWRDQTVSTISRNAVASYGALGYIYRQTGRTERAREAYNRILLLDPNNTDAATDLESLSP